MTSASGSKACAQTSLSLHAPPPHLPCDLVEGILCRLPVKHLRQLCCVCKSWNSLISHDSKFAKKHLRFFSTFSHDRHHIALHYPHELLLWKFPISSLFIDSFTPLSHPLINRVCDYTAVSTCDGILCFGINQFSALLCNPSIRKFKALPLLNNSELGYSRTFYTIVYDRFIGNYKTIALSLCCRGENKKEVNVYTLGTDDWRKIQDFPSHCLCVNGPGIFVSDTVNWLVFDSCSLSRVIVSLDLEKESYQQFLQPPLSNTNSSSLGALRDCLCIFFHSWDFSDLWIMKEYGNEKSWIKLLTVPYIGDPYFYKDSKPLYIYEDGRVLMWFEKKNKFILAVYDSKNNTFMTHEIQNNQLIRAVPKIYVESLISLQD